MAEKPPLKNAPDPMAAFREPYDDVPWPTGKDFLPAKYRIEALRAASRIVAGIFANDAGAVARGHPMLDKCQNLTAATFEIAEQFARWLEDGKR